MHESLLRRLGIEHPLIQAQMSGSTPAPLVAAVTLEGGLGSLGAGYLETQAILDQVAQIRALADRPWAIGLFALLPLTVRALARDVPVIVAGGIMNGRGMVAAEVLGAAASQLGTAFLSWPECSAAEAWKHDLATAKAHQVTTIRGFSGRAARGLRNRLVEAMPQAAQGLPYPILNALTAPLRRAAAQSGRGDLLSEWCAQAASMGRPQPARELVARPMHEYRLAKRSLAH